AFVSIVDAREGGRTRVVRVEVTDIMEPGGEAQRRRRPGARGELRALPGVLELCHRFARIAQATLAGIEVDDLVRRVHGRLRAGSVGHPTSARSRPRAARRPRAAAATPSGDGRARHGRAALPPRSPRSSWATAPRR